MVASSAGQYRVGSSLSMEAIPNPKRRIMPNGSWSGFFPYYAGFPVEFAQHILSTYAPPQCVVLDPWNGSGTTSFTAARLGHTALGVDINPAMIVVARARLLPSSEGDSLLPLAQQIAIKARKQMPLLSEDSLLLWFDARTATVLRSIERSISTHLIGSRTLASSYVELDHISSLAAVNFVALFAVARELARNFRGTNPTWTRSAKIKEQLISCPRSEIENLYLSKIRQMANSLLTKLPIQNNTSQVELLSADVSQPLQIDTKVDFVLTSPPYCTRLDYTSATRIELAILSGLITIDIDSLRRRMTGTTTVPREVPAEDIKWGPTCLDFLDKVRNHSSRASSGYYYKNHADYFGKIFRSLVNCRAKMNKGSHAVFVVQDSYYKEIHNDLPQIFSEMAEAANLAEIQRRDFSVRSIASINPRAALYKKRCTATESVIFFRAN